MANTLDSLAVQVGQLTDLVNEMIRKSKTIDEFTEMTVAEPEAYIVVSYEDQEYKIKISNI